MSVLGVFCALLWVSKTCSGAAIVLLLLFSPIHTRVEKTTRYGGNVGLKRQCGGTTDGEPQLSVGGRAGKRALKSVASSVGSRDGMEQRRLGGCLDQTESAGCEVLAKQSLASMGCPAGASMASRRR
ncbi:hypothetical protein QBC40DRAFT_284305 [Triangularia verruculosa]|uniref:Secreted protein n=1 Tax=Triangularia verruculosa TaxID=2587418 RepID=A0AAN6XCQ7_9PEZI|nr:hypothetical protein QBC40DRAFT_284305 [Triangularia verruculosa]